MQLAANTTGGEIGYGVVCGVIFLVYILVLGLWYFNKYSGVKDKNNSGGDLSSETELEEQQQK